MTAANCLRCGHPAEAHPPQRELRNGITQSPMLASRVMKARHTTTCPWCQQPIRIGNQIGKTTLGWLHIGCVIARMYQQQDGAQ